MRFRRNSLGLTQEALGTLLGLTFQQIQKYERGVNRISASRLLDMAGALRCSYGFFFEGLPDFKAVVGEYSLDPGEVALTEFMQTRECAELCQAFLSLHSDTVRKAALQLVRAIGETGAL